MGIYVFGSQVHGQGEAGSDLDVAVLLEGYAEPVNLWKLGNQLAENLIIDVDLIDLRAASTVMQYQVLTGGQRLWSRGIETDQFELFVFSEKYDLDLWRQGIVDQIHEKGTSMADDVVLNKCAMIERCVQRIQEEWDLAGANFDTDYTRQDAAILNIQRAC